MTAAEVGPPEVAIAEIVYGGGQPNGTALPRASPSKVCVTHSPLGVNWRPNGWAFFRYLMPHWVLVEADSARSRYLQAHISEAWTTIDAEHVRLWRQVFGSEQAEL